MQETNRMNDSNDYGISITFSSNFTFFKFFSGIFRKFLNFIGYLPSTSLDDQNTLRPHMVSNQTDGLDVRLMWLFKKYGENKLVESNKRQMQLILPGTLWCGDGNIAESEQDLGLFYKTDQCCKLHDYCPKHIEAGDTFMNLENIGVFTRSHCECDRAFYNCLKKADSIISNRIGETYFNVLKPQCFSKQYPIAGCIKRRLVDEKVQLLVSSYNICF